MTPEKLIIISAPSGSGKSTIINYLLSQDLGLEFSISATTRLPRGEEKDGVDYHFLSVDDFKQRIANGEFIEYEEVYPDRFYGTLKSEVSRISAKGKMPIFDVDVVGGVNIKKIYLEQALSLFIQPPSVEELRRRLVSRGTDSEDKIAERIAKSEWEMTFASQFDKIIINDELTKAQQEAVKVIRDFIKTAI
jgi:guanylate kinase